MAKLGISTGTTPNDGTGDNLLAGAVKINSNFNEIYTRFGDGTNLTSIGGTWTSTSVGIHTLKNVGIGTTNPRFLLEVGAVGASGTTLFVNGNARVTGILTIGTASITLNGATNIINVGTGITINGSTGIISATSIVLGGTTLTGAAVTSITAGSGISVNQSTGNVTITATGGGGSSQWVSTAAGIHTLSNVGIGTTNPTSALTVKGNTSLETLNVTGVSTFGGNINVSDKNILFGLSAGSSDDRIVWGASSAEIYTNTTNLFLKTNLTSLNLQGEIISLSNYAGDEVLINASNGGSVDLYYNNSKKLETTGTGITVTGTIFTNQLNVSGVSTLTTTDFTGHVQLKANSGNSSLYIFDDNGIYAGTGSDLRIWHNSSDSISRITEDGGQLIIDANPITINHGGNTKLQTIGSGITVTGTTFTNQLSVSGISTLGTVQISSGIVTATSGIVTYYGDTSNAADGRWTLGASGNNDYTFTGIGFTQTTNDPVLYLARGRVYEFVNNSVGNHPFEIRVSNGGSAYSNGVTNNAAASGIIRFEIPFNAPNTLYYQCTNHSGMGNTISVYPSTL